RPHRLLPLLAAVTHALASASGMNPPAGGSASRPGCACPPPPIRSLRPFQSPRLAPRARDKSDTIGDSYHRAESPGPWTDNPCGTSLRQRKREYIIAIQLVTGFDFFTASDARATCPAAGQQRINSASHWQC